MEYVARGKYRFSKLTLGTVQLGVDYGISNTGGKPSPVVVKAILDAAFTSGINTVDTSETYGTAEQLIGDYLSYNGMLQPMHIVTKFKVSEQPSYDTSSVRKEIRNSLQSSLTKLGVPKISIYLLHVGKGQQLDELIEPLTIIFHELRDEGLIDIAGISAYAPGDIDYALKHDIIEAVQVPINIFDHRLINDGRLDELQKRNMIVFARSIFLQGLFFLSPSDLPQHLQEAKPFLVELEHVSRATGKGIAQLAFDFVNDLKAITSIVFGAVNSEQVRQNVALLNKPSATPAISDWAMKAFANVPERILIPGSW